MEYWSVKCVMLGAAVTTFKIWRLNPQSVLIYHLWNAKKLTNHCLSFLQQLDAVSPLGATQGILRGGQLSGDYQILQLHFHWGANDNQGSEHTVDGKMFVPPDD